MKLFSVFSLTLFTSAHMPLLYLSVLLCSLCFPSSLCLSALFISVHWCFIFNGSFRSLSLPLFSPGFPSLSSYLPQVDYRTEDGTANAGSDYEFAEGTLLFKPGETLKGKRNINNNNL